MEDRLTLCGSICTSGPCPPGKLLSPPWHAPWHFDLLALVQWAFWRNLGRLIAKQTYAIHIWLLCSSPKPWETGVYGRMLFYKSIVWLPSKYRSRGFSTHDSWCNWVTLRKLFVILAPCVLIHKALKVVFHCRARRWKRNIKNAKREANPTSLLLIGSVEEVSDMRS